MSLTGRIHCLQHVSFEGPGVIESWTKRSGWELSKTELFANQSLPQTGDLDWLVVMGGPMGVADVDRYPWLADEKRFIRKAIDEGKKVLGICLGAQLIAEVLGAPVVRHRHKEIGWFPVKALEQSRDLWPGLPEEFNAFHWHGDIFGIPEGAHLLVSSQACAHQAFVSENGFTLGMQFHLEMTLSGIRRLRENCAHELEAGEFVGNERDFEHPVAIERANLLMFGILDEMASR